MERVLLTGGCGFIGSHLTEHLLRNTDWEIEVIDSISYAGDAARLYDISCFDRKRVKIHWHSLNAPIPSSLARRMGHIDYVINMAAETHVDRSIKDPIPFFQNNVNVALHMLEYARHHKPVKFIQISTDEVYGPAPDGVFHAEWSLSLPSNPYSASKAAQEMAAIAFWRTYGVPVIITNTMNNFGERQHVEKMVPKCISLLRRGVPVPVHAEKVGQDPTSRWVPGSRVWLHARNHADALLHILRNVEPIQFITGQQDRPERFHIAGEKELDNLQIVKLIAEALGVEPLYQFEDVHTTRPGHDRRYALDGSKLYRDWAPPVPLEESLKRTVKWSVDHPEWLT